jgi:membrane protease YdiL (CAAX protease family)
MSASRHGEDAFAPIPAGARLAPLWAIPLVIVLFVLATVAVLVVAGIALGAAGVMEPDAIEGSWRVIALIVTVGLSVMAGMIILWVTYFERRSLATVGLGRFSPAGDLGWFVAGLVFALGVALAIGYGGGGGASDLDALPAEAGRSPAQLLTGAAVLSLILLPNSVVEELLFRGWALSVIGRRRGVWWAVGITSAVFGAAHVHPWEWGEPARLLSFVSYTFAGAAFAWLALWRKSLWAPIAFHTGFNTLLVTAAYAEAGLSPSTFLERVTASPLGTEQVGEAVVWLVVEVVFAAVLYGLWRRSRAASRSGEGVTPASA